jgi:2-amino-4-hydroxy-6-hydroxymethyldihydropteridine diphosphokinase
VSLVVAVGSNLGAREASIRCAQALLDARDGIVVRRVSKIYETEPLGLPQPKYLNAAFRLDTELSPSELLETLLRTERRLGRRRDPEARWGPRSVDLDLLWDARGPHESSGLKVPHAELEHRGFALAPLLEVAPELGRRYGHVLETLGGPPNEWIRPAIIRASRSPFGVRVEVEADSIADACALCLGPMSSAGRPWSTRHLTIDPSSESFAATLREVFRTGFAVHRATISHCSEAQWKLEIHGVNWGMPTASDVRLLTTSGAQRQIRAVLDIDRPLR